MKYFIGFIAAVVVACVAYFGFLKSECPQCPECQSIAKDTVKDYRQALLSLADIALDRKSKSQSEIESLVKYDKDFYMAFYKTELGKNWFYARHGSCCPCLDGGRGCCACMESSAFGAPINTFLLANNSEADKSPFTFASYSAQQQQAQKREPLKLNKNTIDVTDVFTVPANTAPGYYFVTFKGKIDLVLDIDVREDGGFDIVSFR